MLTACLSVIARLMTSHFMKLVIFFISVNMILYLFLVLQYPFNQVVFIRSESLGVRLESQIYEIEKMDMK